MPLIVTDLTFHEMSFLKQPRREPQKPLSRRRETDKRRGEREQEEISAFFLHKSLPDRYDAQGIKQPRISVLSSLDGTTGGVSVYGSERPNHQNHSSPDFSKDHHLSRGYDRTQHREREGSKGSTYITWSTSHKAPTLGDESVDRDLEERHREDARSSTPVHVREALIRSGIFENTGISSLPALRLEGEGPRGTLKDSLVDASHPNTPAGRAACDQPLRLVHYQDRGTMANEEVAGLDGQVDNTRASIINNESTDANAEKLAEQATIDIATTFRVPANETSAGQPKQINVACGPSPNTSESTTPDVEGCGLISEPERPKSPKWMVIKQLEAAVKDVKHMDRLSMTSPVAKIAEEHVLPTGNRFFEPHQTLFSTADRIAYPNAPDLMHNARWSAFGAAPTPSQKFDILPGIPTPSYQSGSSGEPHFSFSTHQGPFQRLAVMDLLQDTDDAPFQGQPSSSRAVISSTQTSRRQQRLHDYIAEIEREVLGCVPEPHDSKASPIMGRDVQDPGMAHLSCEDEPSRMCFQPYIGTSGPPPDHALSSLSQHSRAHAYSLEEDEEQRFMSSFWRPNGLPL